MNRRFVLFAVAFLVALAGTGAVYGYVSQLETRAVADQQPIRVLVAKVLIPAGTLGGALGTDLVEVKSFARASVPENALLDLAGFETFQLLSDTYPGEVLLAAKFAPEAPPNSGALTIPEGKLAVSLTLDDPRGVAGFVTPGADVAIFDTYDVTQPTAGGPAPPSDNEESRATRLLLERITVLAVGPTVKQSAGDAAPPPEDSGAGAQIGSVALTLAVSQAEAEKLINAAETGSLWFGLLSKTSQTAPSEGVDSSSRFAANVR